MPLSKRQEQSLLAMLQQTQEANARESYTAYLAMVHHGRWLASPHLLLVCRHIEAVLAGQTQRLIIQMPPQHGKSITVTETLPSYFLGHYPDQRVIVVAYGEDLALHFGRRNREKIDRFGRLFGIALANSNRSEREFELAGHTGGMIARGLGGAITGRAADLLIIDDPIRNRQDADSETYRSRLWDEWLNTISTRLAPDGRVILIQTRWHEDDLAGRLQREEPELWTVLSLPCEAEAGDLLGRKPGEALFPAIGRDKVWLTRFKRSYLSTEGSRAWNSLYQQRPAPAQGALFRREWWQYYDHLPKFDRQLQSWDCTFKDGAGTDFVVGQVWGVQGARLYLLDQVRERMDFVATIAAIQRLSRLWPEAVTKLIEDRANGPAVVAMLRQKVPGLVAVNPKGSKHARASAVTPLIEAGNVYLPRHAPWVGGFIEECAAFPLGLHDDQVDAMSQALARYLHLAREEQESTEDPVYPPAFGRTNY